MIVMKFGGTSVGSAKRINDVADIVKAAKKDHDVVIVVSAVTGITNLLLKAAESAANRSQPQLEKHLEKIRSSHYKIISDLSLPETDKKELLKHIDNAILHLESLLYSIYELAELTKRSKDLITSFGERMSIQLVAFAIEKKGIKAKALEATDFLITTNSFGNSQPKFPETAEKVVPLVKTLLRKKTVPVITGYIGSTEEGVLTTLGRGGSDYSATILGNCLDAEEVWIWTDVNGVMTADPRIVKRAQTIEVLSYNEASELSYFGAKVLHPLTMVPAALKNIPIVIKNTFNPSFTGTRIEKNARDSYHVIKAITTFNGISLITLQGKGMIGVPGVAAKLFDTIAENGINVHFISQASSEFNISFVVAEEDCPKTIESLKNAFELELLNKFIDKIIKEDGLSIVAVVGQGMRGKPGIAGKTFSSLGEAGISIRAIAQGSSERNISFLLNESDVNRAVQTIHDAFGLAQ
jgi:aspartate kinase